MKLFALLVVLAGCGAPPTEVEEISSALMVLNPPYTSGMDIYVGYRTDVQATGVFYRRRSDNSCLWQSISPGGGAGGSPTQEYTVLGGPNDDVMLHVDGQFTFSCRTGTYTLLTPRQSNGWPINLSGKEGNDLIFCMGAGVSGNTCAGGLGNDVIYAQLTTNAIFGDGGNDSILITASSPPQVTVFAGDGNDCVSWVNGTAGPAGNGGPGSDGIKNLAGSSQYEFTSTCGF